MLMSRLLPRSPQLKAASWTAANVHTPGLPQRPLMSQNVSQDHYETDDGTYVFTRGSVHDVAKQILVERRAEQEAFFVCDVRDIAKKVDLWRQCLPRIMPFYGVKKVQQDVFINESRDNCVSRNLYDYLDVKIWPLQEPLERPRGVPTTVWGGTCNPVDCIERKPLFHVNVGEWLLMDNIGAYSLSRASGFNGLPYPAVHYIAPQENVSALLDILNVSPLRSGYGQPEGVLKRSLLTRWRSEATGCDEQSNLAPAAALPC